MKFLFKAEFTPGHVDKALYFVAPVVIFVTAIAVFAVIPFGSVLPAGLFPASWGVTEPIRLVIAPGRRRGRDLRLRHGQHRRLRRGAGRLGQQQQVQFPGRHAEQRPVDLLRTAAGPGHPGRRAGHRLAAAGRDHPAAGRKRRLERLRASRWAFGLRRGRRSPRPRRLPFDLPEAEQELVGGYHTEYFGVKLLMYLVAEYMHMITAAFLIAILFLGGWHFWGLTGSGDVVTWPVAILRVVVLMAKVLGVIFFFMLARWSWPRFRFDQLMALAWLVMLPLGMVNVVAVACGWSLAPRLALGPAGCRVACGWIVLLALDRHYALSLRGDTGPVGRRRLGADTTRRPSRPSATRPMLARAWSPRRSRLT